jgi:pimeloyl-ACP methyl ester carboxylesterase
MWVILRTVAAAASLFLVGPAFAEQSRIKLGAAEIAVEQYGDAGPVVILESGLGTPMDSFRTVAERLGSCMRVTMYDRPGIGASGPRPEQGPVLASEAADRLDALIDALDLPAPRIIVGHSLGGFNAQIYARRHPQHVAAVVLIDAASQFEPPGVFVTKSVLAPGSIDALEEAGLQLGMAAISTEPPFPPVPLVVLAATDHAMPADTETLWLETQAKIPALSPKGRLDVIEGSGHYIQVDRPEAVVAAIIAAADAAGLAHGDCGG